MNQIEAKVKYRKGIAYFQTFEEAQAVSKQIDGSRVVGYELGWAVQYRVSGPYFPEYDPENPYSATAAKALSARFNS
jgi:hypothetical protein